MQQYRGCRRWSARLLAVVLAGAPQTGTAGLRMLSMGAADFDAVRAVALVHLRPLHALPGTPPRRVGPSRAVQRHSLSPHVPASAPPVDTRLLGFFRALEAIDRGRRRDPVVVLQIGDSHTANDAFSGRLRELFQARFGAAGRGVLPPGIPYAYFRPAGVQVTATGWDRFGTKAIVPGRDSPPPAMIGLTAARMHSAGPAEMTYRVDEPADLQRVAIEILYQPGGGTLQVAFDGHPAWLLSTSSSSTARPGHASIGHASIGHASIGHASIGHASIDHASIGHSEQAMWVDLPPAGGARLMTLRAQGDGPVDLLGIDLRRANGSGRAGVIWSNLGTIGATVAQVDSWSPEVVAADLGHLRPDLVVLAFGTNEGFATGFDAAAYQAAYAEAGRRLTRTGATLAVIEPPDGNRRVPLDAAIPAAASTIAAAAGAAPVLPTTAAVACGPALDEAGQTTGAWAEPPVLALVRGAQADVARRENWFTWNWAAAMGGPCSMAAWAVATPSLAYPDHVHLREAGARQTAEALFSALMSGYARFRAASHGP